MRHRTFLPPQPRRLKLHYLHHPRSYPGPDSEWELHRGFRIRVLSRHALALFIGQPPPVSDLLSKKPEPGEDSFLLIPAPAGPRAEHLAFGLEVAREEGWTPSVTMLLSDDRHLQVAPGRLRRKLKAVIPENHSGLVLWVWQEMPMDLCQGVDFFNPEQILHQFGRIGRRVKRRSRWRPYKFW